MGPGSGPLDTRGESVKGGPLPPVHKLTTTNRNSPPRAGGAQGSCDCRREAPGGSGTGPLVPAQKAPVHRSRLWAPVPDRSTRGGKVRKGGHRPPFTRRKRPIGTRHRAPEARKEVSIPEPGAARSRVPRPQPLLLRGLRAARAPLRKPELRSGQESGSPTPTPPAPGSPCDSRRTPEARRGAPGVPGSARHPEERLHAVSRPSGPRCRSEDRRSRACAPSAVGGA